MSSPRWGMIALCVAMVIGAFTSACRAHYVVVPAPGDGYTAADTLWGYLDGEEVRVTFRFDTVTRLRVDTVLRVDTLRMVAADDDPRPPLRRGGDPREEGRAVRVDTVFQVDTLVRVDTVRTPADDPDARRAVRVDPGERRDGPLRVDTVVRVDTVRVGDVGTRIDTVLVVDTVWSTITDTVMVIDTVVRTETVRVPGQRVLFVPPGQHPPQGQCRVWIHDLPPGQQARPAPCDQLSEIPEGAFVLFAGEAWDFDYDWLTVATEDPGAVPPEIVALQRPGRPQGDGPGRGPPGE